QECFRKVGAPTDPSDIGVTRQQLKDMMPFVQLMRWRMNLLDLARRGGFYDELVEKVKTNGLSDEPPTYDDFVETDF
ncbi:MAG: hypothetical protein IKK39_16630, partial [Thermoguttaceae bacterium]|nr:hypothetical protein [Thermoguttaceae bacterium]